MFILLQGSAVVISADDIDRPPASGRSKSAWQRGGAAKGAAALGLSTRVAARLLVSGQALEREIYPRSFGGARAGGGLVRVVRSKAAARLYEGAATCRSARASAFTAAAIW